MADRKPDPSIEEVRRRMAEVRREWDEQEQLRRAVIDKPTFGARRWRKVCIHNGRVQYGETQ